MFTERVIVDEKKTENIINIILNARVKEEYIFNRSIVPPELPVVNLFKEYGERINDDRFAPNALFLTTMFVRGGWTSRYFENIFKQNSLEKYAWIFEPEKVVVKNETNVLHNVNDFLKPPGYSVDGIKKWVYNSKLLLEYGADIRKYFSKFDGDAEAVVKALYVRNRAKIQEKINVNAFLGYGQKLAHLVIQFMHQYNLFEFKNSNNFGIPVDFQIARILIENQGFQTVGDANANEIVFAKILPLLKKLSKINGWDLGNVSETMWLFGNNACTQKKHGGCPLYDNCKGWIGSTKYQQQGTLNSDDLIKFKG